jgi:predicted nucleotidyltransferase
MRKTSTLDSLFPNVRAGLLSATMLRPEHWCYMTELAKHLGAPPSSLQRELHSLVQAGFLLRRQDGRRIYFKANTESPLFPELRGIVEKTSGVIPALKTALDKFREKIVLALIYGSMARGKEHAGSDIDLMVIGRMQQIDLLPTLRKLENRFHREVNVTLFSPDEFERKRASADHFVSSVLKGKTIFLKGSVHELENASTKRIKYIVTRPVSKRSQNSAGL